MGLYAAWLTVEDSELNLAKRPEHLKYLEGLYAEGKVAWAGPFSDRTGGLVIYRADSDAQAQALAQADPVVSSGARTVTIRRWELLDFPEI